MVLDRVYDKPVYGSVKDRFICTCSGWKLAYGFARAQTHRLNGNFVAVGVDD